MSVLVLQPDAAAGVDTVIANAASANLNFGIASPGSCGHTTTTIVRMLLQFSGITIPAGATISSAILTLYCESETSTTDYAVGVHRALTQWFEGAQNGGTPGPGENASVWNLRNYNGAVAWAGGAGGGSGSDYAAIATASTLITQTGITFDWNVLADVQAWYAGTATNYGWWLKNVDEVTNNTLKRFTLSDGASNRPKLTITYTVPGGDAPFNAAFDSAFRGPFG